MASSCKTSSSRALQVAAALVVLLLLLLLWCAAVDANAQNVNSVKRVTVGVAPSVVTVTFLNQLPQAALRVTIGAPPLGMPSSITLPPGGSGSLALNVLAPLVVRDVLEFQVGTTHFIDTASGGSGALGRLVAETGVLSIAVSDGPCADGQAGLVLMDYAAGVLINDAGCALRQD